MSADAAAPAVDWLGLALGLAGGLALFLFALDELARLLRQTAGERMRAWLGRAAATPWRGAAAGAGATVALDSSTATIVMLIAFVDAGLLGAGQALPVVLGANVGTTASTQLLATGLDDWSPLLFAAALLAGALLRSPAAKRYARIAAMLALILFALALMGTAVKPLVDHPDATAWLNRLENPLFAVAVGAGVTAALQSSSATMGLVIALASSGALPLEGALGVMLGAEIGTCADTLVAAIGRSAGALRVGLFHLAFNVAGAGAGLVLLDQLAAFARWSAADPAVQVANAQVAFNVAGAALGLTLLAFARRGADARAAARRPGGAPPARIVPSRRAA